MIEAPANGPQMRYIGGVTLDGEPWTRNYLPWSDLADGAVVRFAMQAEPDTGRGTQPDDAPYSYSRRQCR